MMKTLKKLTVSFVIKLIFYIVDHISSMTCYSSMDNNDG